MIQYHLLLARKHGESTGAPLLAAFDDPHPLRVAYADITGPHAAEFASVYGELLFVENGVIISHHEYPDPRDAEAQRKARVLADARLAIRERDAAKAALDTAKQRAADAAAAIKSLTPEQQSLLDEDNARRKAAESAAAQAKAQADAAAKAEQEAREKAEADAAAQREAAAKAAAESAADLIEAAPKTQTPAPAESLSPAKPGEDATAAANAGAAGTQP